MRITVILLRQEEDAFCGTAGYHTRLQPAASPASVLSGHYLALLRRCDGSNGVLFILVGGSAILKETSSTDKILASVNLFWSGPSGRHRKTLPFRTSVKKQPSCGSSCAWFKAAQDFISHQDIFCTSSAMQLPQALLFKTVYYIR